MKAVILSLILSIAGSLNGMAAVEAYMRIVGEPTFVEQGVPSGLVKEGFFPLGSVSIGVENTVSIGSISAGGGAGKASFKSLILTKAPGRVSTDLFKKLVSGNHYDEVEIVLLRSGGDPLAPTPYVMTFGLKLVMAESLDFQVSEGDDKPLEVVKLQFGAIRIRYYKQDAKGGVILGSEEVWSRVLNRPEYSAGL